MPLPHQLTAETWRKAEREARHRRDLANALWEALAALGIRDSIGGSEYRRELGDPDRLKEYAIATREILRRFQP